MASTSSPTHTFPAGMQCEVLAMTETCGCTTGELGSVLASIARSCRSVPMSA